MQACKDRGKILFSAEPSESWQQNPVPLSWDAWAANSAQKLVSTNAWLAKIAIYLKAENYKIYTRGLKA